MARIERIKRRLDNWALWKARQAGGGLGFHTKNILAVDVWGRSSYNGAAIPHFDEEAEETDRAVQSMKLGKGHLHVTLECIYLRDLGVNATAQRMQRAVSTVHSQLDAADRYIDAWLQDQAQQREERAAKERGRELFARTSTSP